MTKRSGLLKRVLAFDFGASSGRAIKAVFEHGKIFYEEIHRFENIPVEKNSHIFHDIDMIMRQIDEAIDKAGDVDALAFDTWGVDYALIGKNSKLISLPYHYRDDRTADALEKVISPSELYSETGNQIMAINTLFQLLVDDNVSKCEKLVFMPDLFGYILTGKAVCEYTIASTSQMLNPVSRSWSEKILDTYCINKNIFPPLTKTASVLGQYRGIDVITVAGHDTQCAVTAMPVTDNGDTAFLSCGTWSLIGCELDEPILTEQSNEMQLSNEIGANGKINYLKNISGLWLIQELRRDLAQDGEKYSYNTLELLARKSEAFVSFIDPDDFSLSRHGSMVQKIQSYCEKTKQAIPSTTGEIVRCIYESLALKYRYAIEQISQCSGKKFEALHMLGGGTKDKFLCEMTANCLNIKVIAGPVEATALGNIILQLKALGEIESVSDGRRLIAKSENLVEYNPVHSQQWDLAYERYKKLMK